MKTISEVFTRGAWCVIAEKYLGMPTPLAEKLYRIFCRERRNPHIAAILFALRRPLSLGVDVEAAATAAFAGPLRPTRMVPLMETLCEQGLISRSDASRVQEAFLARANARGEWKEW